MIPQIDLNENVAPVKVIFADDSPLIRRLLGQVIHEDPQLVAALEAENGLQVVRQFFECKPDVILLDTEMPAMNGLEAVVEIRRKCQRVPIVMFASPNLEDSDLVSDAMVSGANDFCNKPPLADRAHEALEDLRRELTPRLVMWGAAHQHQQRQTIACPGSQKIREESVRFPFREVLGAGRYQSEGPKNDADFTTLPGGKSSVDVIVIAASHENTDPLIQVLVKLPLSFEIPVLVTIEGMQPRYASFLVDRLTEFCELPVRNAEHDQLLYKGISVAPGGQQMVIQRVDESARTFLKCAPPDAVAGFSTGVLFTSAAIAFGNRVLGVVLAGTEKDCIAGCKMLRWKGGRLIIETRQNSVKAKTARVFSDPNLPTRCLAVEDIADAIKDSVSTQQHDITQHACIEELH